MWPCVLYLLSLWPIIQIPSSWSQVVPERTESLPQRSPKESFLEELPLLYCNLFLSEYVMIGCFQPDSFLLPHVPWRSRCLLIKAMCILSPPAQLLKPESGLENISPNCTVFHPFFLTPPDNLLAYCLSLLSIAPVGVGGLSDITQEFIIRNKNASFQIYNTRRQLERFLEVVGETPNVKGLFWSGGHSTGF